MKISDILPIITYEDIYQFRDIFKKYFLEEEIDEKYLKIVRVGDGDSIEKISYDEYGTTDYKWTIMIVNNFIDPLFDIALSETAIQAMARSISIIGGELDMPSYLSNYTALSEENDAKREIKIIKREFIHKFLTKIIKLRNESGI